MKKPDHLSSRNAHKVTPQERARICEAIRHEIALEYLHGTNSRREAWARICIGLKAFPRRITEGTSA